MNQDQITGVLRAVVPAMLSYIAGAGWLNVNDISSITAAIITLVAAGWSIYTNTHKAKVAGVAAMDHTKVSDNGKTITILDPVLARVAKENATAPVAP